MNNDSLIVREILKEITGSDVYNDITRLGGLTNRTYKVQLETGEKFVIRIPGLGTEKMINRNDEKISTELAASIGVDTPLVYWSNEGIKVTTFIPQAITMNAQKLKEPHRIEQVAEIFRKLHTCEKDTKVPFEVFEMATNYENIIHDNQVEMFSDYQHIKDCVMTIKQETDNSFDIKKVPCHNDPLCENWVDGEGKLYLIDWEYAGMNDGMWDLAALSIEAEYDAFCDTQLLTFYLGHTPEKNEILHFLANKIYVDYLWTLWAKTRVPFDGDFMEQWAVSRYTRLKGFIQQYNNIEKN